MKRLLIFIFLLITLYGCTYSDEYQLMYEPSEGTVFAEKLIDTSKISVRLRATDFSGSSSGTFTSKIRSKGPYILDFRIRDFEKNREKLIIHSAIIKDKLTQGEFNLLPEETVLKLPFVKSVNGKVISWNVSHPFESQPFQPTFTENQKLNVFIEISVISDGTAKREKLHFVLKSKVSKHKGLLPLSAKYGH